MREWLSDLAEAFSQRGSRAVMIHSENSSVEWLDAREDAVQLELVGTHYFVSVNATIKRDDLMLIHVLAIVNDDGSSPLAQVTVIDPQRVLEQRRRYGWHQDNGHEELGECHEHLRDGNDNEVLATPTIQRLDQLLGPIRKY